MSLASVALASAAAETTALAAQITSTSLADDVASLENRDTFVSPPENNGGGRDLSRLLGGVAFVPGDPELRALMEPIPLADHHQHHLRLYTILASFAFPILREITIPLVKHLIVRPVAGLVRRIRGERESAPRPAVFDRISLATGAFEATVGLARDAAALPLIGAAIYVEPVRSISCYAPEAIAVIALALSVGRRIALWREARKHPEWSPLERHTFFWKGLGVFK